MRCDIHYQTKSETNNNLRDLIKKKKKPKRKFPALTMKFFAALRQGHTPASAELRVPRRSISITYSAAFEEKSSSPALWLIYLEPEARVTLE